MKHWTKYENDFLRKNYEIMTCREMGETLGRSAPSVTNRLFIIGLKRSDEARNKLQSRTYFKKGQSPWNKGLRGLHLSPKTEFKKGHLPFNAKYDGCITIRKAHSTPYKYIRLKLGVWKEMHRFVWETYNGKKIPPKHVVRFKDGNTLNCHIDNLELLPMSVHARRNYRPPQLTDNYCAFTLAHGSPLSKEDMLENKELIELQRNKLQLKREIHKWQKT